MTPPPNPYDPATWPTFRPCLIAHDVARSRDHATAVVGGFFPLNDWATELLGVGEMRELPQGMMGHALANEVAAVDRKYLNNALIFVDVTNNEAYGEVMHEYFGARVIGLRIGASGDGMTPQLWPVKTGQLPVFNVGRTHLFELLRLELETDKIKFADRQMAQYAYQQLAALIVEHKPNGTFYTCPSGMHDDLAISVAMLAWAARHPHLSAWIEFARPQQIRARQKMTPAAWT